MFLSNFWPEFLFGFHFSKPRTICLTCTKLIIQFKLVILRINCVDNFKLCNSPAALQILAEIIQPQSNIMYTEIHRLRGNGANVNII